MESADRVRQALGRIKEELPALADVVDAFRDLMVERAALREELARGEGSSLPEIDGDKFLQGVPIAQEETFIFSRDDLDEAARRLIPAMEKGLPVVREGSASIRNALLEGSPDLQALAKLILENRREEIDDAARDLGLDPRLLEFIVGQLLKPLVENRVGSMTPLPEELQWVKGYCPVCGSWPGLSLIRGVEGQRLLKCSFCSHEWRFSRTQCPFCENTDFDSMEYLYSEERDSERVEVCRKCERYILSIDLRNRDDVVLDVAPIGLLYLDLIARQHGFRPGAITEWNVPEERGE
jgi:FdhE protein